MFSERGPSLETTTTKVPRNGSSMCSNEIGFKTFNSFKLFVKGAYEYGMGLLMAALVLRRSAGLAPDKNRHLAAMLGSIWNRLLAAIREQMTRLRVAGLFYRDVTQVSLPRSN
jgi:hypothetical protein